jgi:outer membrane immunogenic protein
MASQLFGMRGRIFFFGLATLLPLSAQAADLPAPPPPVAFPPLPVSDWRGPYAGTFVGAGLGVFSTRETASASGSGTGFTTGVLGGYNWQTGAIVYGLEGDIATNTMQHSFAGAPGLTANTVEEIYALHGRARLGYDLGAFMPFVAGGVAFGQNEQFRQAPLEFDGATHNSTGWTLGAGVDVKVALPLLGLSVLRGEYLYEAYPTTTFGLNGPVLHTNIADHIFRVALISRIGETWRAPANPDVIDWAGDYAGVIGGGAWDWLTTSGNLGGATKFGAAGPFAGAYTGHNWMFGQTMLGLEGATTLGHIAGHGGQPGAITTSYNDYAQSDFRGRVGYSIGRFMPFLAAGVSYNQSRQIDTLAANDQGLVPSWAGTAGVGLDYMLTERLAFRAEYLYSRSLANETTHLDSDACCTQRRTSDTLRFGLAYYFH